MTVFLPFCSTYTLFPRLAHQPLGYLTSLSLTLVALLWTLTFRSLCAVQPEQIRLLLPDVLIWGGCSEGVVPLPLHQHSVQTARHLAIPRGRSLGQLHLHLPFQPGPLRPGVSKPWWLSSSWVLLRAQEMLVG